MSRWKIYLTKTIYHLDAGVDNLRYRLSERFSNNDSVAFPYLSYGTREKLLLKGRVLRAKNLQPAGKDSSFWKNFKNAYKRFDSDEIPYAKLTCRFHGQQEEISANDEGFFEHWLELKKPLEIDHDFIQTVELELVALKRHQAETRFSASIMVPSEKAKFGIVSDLDDTVLQTGAGSVIGMMKKVLFGNAYTRLPFEGVADFYTALHRNMNPIFYVSSSPWNLYDVLIEFFDIQNIPMGPLILRDWGISASEFIPRDHKKHKLEVITAIFNTYSSLPFILIGDSGQEDPEIYADLVKQYPGRILAIYIRDVSENAKRDEQIQNLALTVKQSGADLLLVPDTAKAWEHAQRNGWLD